MTSEQWHEKLDEIVKHNLEIDVEYVVGLMDDLAASEIREKFNAEALLASERSRFAGMRMAFVAGAEKYSTIVSDEGMWINDLRDMQAEAVRRYPDEWRQQHGKAT